MKALELSRDILRKEIIVDRTVSRVIGLSCFITLTALGAYVRIPLPFTPVPITLQTFFVLLAGAVLGRQWGVASQLGYVLLGVFGLPIFAGASFGLAVFFGPTGGYLLGFILAGWMVGRIISRHKIVRFNQILITMLIGSLLIDLLGCIWLGMLLRINLKKVLMLGLWPFLPGDTMKSIVAALVYQKIQKRIKQIFLPE